MRFNRNPLFIPTIPLFYMHINSDHDLKITIKNPNRLRPLSTLMQRFKKYPLSKTKQYIFGQYFCLCSTVNTKAISYENTNVLYLFAYLPIKIPENADGEYDVLPASFSKAFVFNYPHLKNVYCSLGRIPISTLILACLQQCSV